MLLLLFLFVLIASLLGFAPRTDLDRHSGPASSIPSLLSGMEARCLILETHLAQKTS